MTDPTQKPLTVCPCGTNCSTEACVVMTESIDMAIAAARERGWIGYEESLAAEIAALRFEIGSLQEQNRILGDCYTEGGVMTENGACYPTCGVPHSHGITHAVGCPNGFVAQTWSDFGVDSMSEAFVLCRNQRAENAALRERVAELENELNQHPEECCKDDRA